MDAGLKVRLNPDGGNQLNIREALRLYLAPIEESSEAPDDEDFDENDNEPRKNIVDDYDYEDDFIDDGEVFEDEVAATPPNERSEDLADKNAAGKLPEKAPAHHGFGNFWVNKGDLPPKRDTTVPQPPSALGNVVLENVKMPNVKDSANGAPAVSSTKPGKPGQGKAGVKKAGEAPQKGTSATTTTGPTEGLKKPNATNTVPGTNAKPNNTRPSQTKGKTVQQTVIEEIAKLASLCQTEFGDKKPKLSDPKVQEQLHVMFRAAMAANVGKLFSDIAKDRRVVALADEVWNRLSFLRVKRANLETLGHALIWSAKEKVAIATVEKTETELERFMRERREKASVADGALMAVVFDNEVDTRIFEWYRAKSELQMAKNQLGSRVKSVKKCVGGWVVSLKKTAFQGWSVAEGEIVEAFRRVEDVRTAAEKQRREMEKQQREVEKQRRESEKLEKKRKREEMMAAAAAAAAAKRVAVEKGGGGGAAGAPTAAVPPTTGTQVQKVKSGKVGTGVKVVAHGGIGKPSKTGVKSVGGGEKGAAKAVKHVKEMKGDGKGGAKKGVAKGSMSAKVEAKKKRVPKHTPEKGGKTGNKIRADGTEVIELD